MTRSLSLTAYLALHRGVEPRDYAARAPQRPPGALVWLRGQTERHAKIAATIAEAFGKDGDRATFLCTSTSGSTGPGGPWMIHYASPDETVAGIRAFLRHWSPDAMVWMQGGLDPVSLVETDTPKIGRFLVDATGDALVGPVGTWVPGMTARLLNRFDAILATGPKAATRLRKHGIEPDRLESVGPLFEALPLLRYSEHERQSLAATLGARPVWLATDCDLAELAIVAAAHRQASRRTHRLLLVAVPRRTEDGAELAGRLADLGFDVALRSAGAEPEDATQIYVADTAGDLGLWYRVAPITYLGGSLTGGPLHHPFEAAALGSAIVHGPMIAPYGEAFARLHAGDAVRPIQTADDLGPAIESLLSPDKAAQLANAAWAVTTEGAEACNRLVALLQSSLDDRGR